MEARTLYTWCAEESLIFPVLIGAPARIESPDPVTGEAVRVDVTPTGVERVEPTSAVVSIVTSKLDLAQVRESGCGNQSFYSSPETAEGWLAARPDGYLLGVADAFEVFRRAALRLWPELQD